MLEDRRPPPTDLPELKRIPPRLVADLPSVLPQVLPWRTTATLLEPSQPRLLCVSDPTAAQSFLLVSSWEWVEAEGSPRLRFRLADDGDSIEFPSRSDDEPILEARIRVTQKDFNATLILVTGREERGLRLGRDVLARRFLIDSERDEPASDHDEES
jgi:hypothetical protein